jgi:hypothetical protein
VVLTGAGPTHRARACRVCLSGCIAMGLSTKFSSSTYVAIANCRLVVPVL